nr:uncharacterized protein LOC109154879 [Ipomoea batatas]
MHVFYRVCVSIDVGKPLKKQMKMKRVLWGIDPKSEKPFGRWLRAGMRRGVPSAGHRWIPPVTTFERWNWTAPSQEGLDVTTVNGSEAQNSSEGVVSSARGKEIVQICAPVIDNVEANKCTEGAKACSVICPYSDHTPLMIMPVVVNSAMHRRRFCFDNMWLKEGREIVEHNWDKTMGMDVLDRIAMESLKMRRDPVGKLRWRV